MHKYWCGKSCSVCQSYCFLDGTIPCSLDCTLLKADGEPENLRECLENECGALICVDKICDAIAAEAALYRKKIVRLSSEDVYDKYVFDIHIVQETVYLICECPQCYEGDKNIIWVLYNLSKNGMFLQEYLNWSYTQDSINVSNVEMSFETLKAFCDHMSIGTEKV